MGKRTWFKIYADSWITGSIRKETLETRAIFVDLMAMAASGLYGDDGILKCQNGVGYPLNLLSKVLFVSQKRLSKSLKQLSSSGKIDIDSNGIITILNWKKYQSEYDRQSQYRGKTQEKDVTKSYKPSVTKSYTGVVTKSTPEIEKEIEKENTTTLKKNNDTVFSVIGQLSQRLYCRSLTPKEIQALEKDADEYGVAIMEKAITLSAAERDTSKHNLLYALGIARRLKEQLLQTQQREPEPVYYRDLN